VAFASIAGFPHGDPWANWAAYNADIGDPTSFFDLVSRTPQLYAWFVANSALRFGPVLHSAGAWWFALAVVAFVQSKATWKAPLLVALAFSIAPLVLLTFPHVRYMARFTAVALAVVALRLQESNDGAFRMAMILGAVVGFLHDPQRWLMGYWFPD
jgi:hypothetical protein